MATYMYGYNGAMGQNSQQRRGVAMALALLVAVVLSPLYINRRHKDNLSDTMWNSGLVLPMVLVGLIVAIKTTSSSSSSVERDRGAPQENSSWILRVGSSSWGLAGILVMLLFMLSCQDSVQRSFWR